jgi:release factor glutamine methyltransferase
VTTLGAWRARNATLPRLESDLLLAHVLGIRRTGVLAHAERVLDRDEIAVLDALALRLVAGEPLAYLTGVREFRNLELMVDARVLVPRPETELLVELAIERIGQDARVLELATGSGAIAIALAHARPDLDIVASDVSLDALEVARANAERHSVVVRLLASDWFAALEGRFDAIVANPPYIAAGDPHLAGLGFEPRLALVPGPTGLEAIAAIVATAPAFLEAGGLVMLEHGFDQGAAVRGLLGPFSGVQTFSDLAGHERVTLASL